MLLVQLIFSLLYVSVPDDGLVAFESYMFLVHLFHCCLTWSSKNLNPWLEKVWFPKQQLASPQSIRNTELQAPSENYQMSVCIIIRSSGSSYVL